MPVFRTEEKKGEIRQWIMTSGSAPKTELRDTFLILRGKNTVIAAI